MKKLSEAQETALRLAKKGILTSHVGDKTEDDILGETIPGKPIFQRLIKAGLMFETEEDPIENEDGTTFEPTPSYHLTEEGEQVLAEMNGTSLSI